MPLLVHLDRVNAAILALVVELPNGVLKGLVDLADAMAQNIGEPNQDGQLNAAGLELVYQPLQVDGLLRVLVGMDRDVAELVDAKIALAPVLDAVGIDGILNLPLLD